MAPARAAVLLLALGACAWFVLGVRQVHEIDAVTALLSPPTPLSAVQARHASSLLDSAAALDPDQAVNILRGRLALAQGEEQLSREILHGVVQREPRNLEAWVWYARASANNPVQFYAAQYVIGQLVRNVPAPR